MAEKNLIDKVKLKLASLRRPAWEPITRKGDGPRTAGKFSGLPYLAATEKWPICPECRDPLHFFLQIDLAGLPSPLQGQFGVGLIQLFYCITCSPWEPFSREMAVRRVDPVGPGSGTPSPVKEPFPPLLIAGWKALEPDFPAWDDLPDLLLSNGVELSEEEQEAFGEELSPAQGEKLAGWPFWVQSTEYPSCPTCSRTMRLVFQIDSDKNLPYMFGDAGLGHITQCPTHKDVLAFGWACY